jgi:hypothetical protein
MSNQLALRLNIEPLRSVSAATLAPGGVSAGYIGIGIALTNPSRKLLIQNYTDVLITFSDNGVTDKFVLNPGTQFILDEALNHQGDYTASGTRFYAKGTPSTGNVYLSTWFGAS